MRALIINTNYRWLKQRTCVLLVYACLFFYIFKSICFEWNVLAGCAQHTPKIYAKILGWTGKYAIELCLMLLFIMKKTQKTGKGAVFGFENLFIFYFSLEFMDCVRVQWETTRLKIVDLFDKHWMDKCDTNAVYQRELCKHFGLSIQI